MLLRFVHGILQRIAVTEPWRLRQQLRVVISIVAVSQPKNKILGVRFDALLHDLSTVPVFAVTRVFRITISELSPSRSDFMPTSERSNHGRSVVSCAGDVVWGY